MQVDEGQLRDFLIDSGLITRSQLADLSPDGEKSLYEVLRERNVVAEDELRRAAAHATGTTFVVLTKEDISPTAVLAIPEPLARLHNMLAYRLESDVLEVALLDLDDLAHLAPLKLPYRIKPRLTTKASVKQGLIYYQKILREKFGSLMTQGTHVVDALIHHAILSSANGIHIDLHTAALVRYRIGSVLREAFELPIHVGAQLIEQLKMLAKLLPTSSTIQEGRFRFEKDGERHTVHVTALPTAHGERVVLRLARESAGTAGFALASLGLHGMPLEHVHAMLGEKSGLILVTGPKGGGKTTTLYTLLDQLNHANLSISTIEEKVEHHFVHIAQTEVKPELGLTTLAGLRAILRQDPDVVMIGNINDADTAVLALHAANMGVLVLAGIEAFSTKGAIDKLVDGGVSRTQLASALRGVIGVEAVKRLCTHEREEYLLSRAEGEPLERSLNDGGAGADFGRVLSSLKEEKVVEDTKQWKEILFARAIPCKHCEGGYEGVLGIQEVWPISITLRGMLREGAPGEEIEKGAREEGALNMIEDALVKAAQGQTSIEEVYRLAERS